MKYHKLKKFCDQNVTEVWKMNKKIWQTKPSTLLQAKINHQGKLVQSGSDVKLVMLKEYKERL